MPSRDEDSRRARRAWFEVHRADKGAIAFKLPVAALFAALCIVVSYPGRLNADSLYSIITGTAHADLGNWHSPTLGWLWSLPGPLLGQPAGALLIQSLLFGCYAGFLPRTAPTRAGRLTLALELTFRAALVGAFGFIGKDAVMLGAMLLGVQVFRHGLQLTFGIGHHLVLASLTGLTLLIKAPNFLAFVLALSLALPFVVRSARGYIVVLLTALSLGVLAIPLNRLVDRAVFAAKDVHPDKQLVIFDLAGISVRTGTDAFAVLPGWPAARLPPIATCFLPYMWDAFAPWGPCSGYSLAYDARDGALKRRWAAAILAHPIAYLEHRLTYSAYLLRSRDNRSWGLGGDAINDARAPAAERERHEMMTRLDANRPVQLWSERPVAMPFAWLEAHLLRFPRVQSLAIVGSLAILLLCWLRRRGGVDLGTILPAALSLGNFGMLVAFGVADPARYLLPTTCLFYVALLGLIGRRMAMLPSPISASGKSDGSRRVTPSDDPDVTPRSASPVAGRRHRAPSPAIRSFCRSRASA